LRGVLLDSHAFYWLISDVRSLSEHALLVISDNQTAGTLYVSPITAWELALASRKPAHKNPVDLAGLSPSAWFSNALVTSGARVVPIRQRIACEAAAVVAETGHGDPGDCYLIATARVRRLPIVTRDAVMHRLAAPDYLAVIAC
jgi:PIN domain nuclease of toxin-antitoxin system